LLLRLCITAIAVRVLGSVSEVIIASNAFVDYLASSLLSLRRVSLVVGIDLVTLVHNVLIFVIVVQIVGPLLTESFLVFILNATEVLRGTIETLS